MSPNGEIKTKKFTSWFNPGVIKFDISPIIWHIVIYICSEKKFQQNDTFKMIICFFNALSKISY